MPEWIDYLIKKIGEESRTREIAEETATLNDIVNHPSIFVEAIKDEVNRKAATRVVQWAGRNRDKAKRERAAVLIRQFVEEADFDINVLKKGLSDKSIFVRRHIAWTLEKLSDRISMDEAREELIEAILDDDEKVRNRARKALLKVQDKEKIVEVLTEKLRHYNSQRILIQTGRMGRREVIKTLGELAKKVDISSAIDDIEEGVWALHHSDTRHNTVVALRNALLKGEDRARKGVTIMLRDDTWGYIASEALRDSALQGNEKSLETLMRHLNSSDDKTRKNAAKGLKGFAERGGNVDIERMKKALKILVKADKLKLMEATKTYLEIVGAVKREKLSIRSEGTVKPPKKHGIFRIRRKLGNR